MNNLSKSMKKLMGNKNTVTIIGVVLCIVILYIGYHYRISQEVKLTKIPYAIQNIQPRTQIKSEMVGYMNVPAAFLKGSYYSDANDIIGKYSNYNTMIVEGSIFYTDLLIEEKNLPDSAFIELDENYTPVNYNLYSNYLLFSIN